MEPETFQKLVQLGPSGLCALAIVLAIALAIVVLPKLVDSWRASAERDNAMAATLPAMRDSLADIAQNTKLLERMDEKLDGLDDKLNLILGRK